MQTKEDLMVSFKEKIKNLPDLALVPESERLEYRLMHTSGTTGAPLPVLYTQRPDWNEVMIGEGKRVLMMFGSRALCLDFLEAVVHNKGKDVAFLTGSSSVEESTALVCGFCPDTIVSPPGVLVRQMKHWPSEVCENIINVVIGGELASEHATALIRSTFPNAHLVNEFAATEAGFIGRSCRKCAYNEFHPYDGVTFVINEPNENGEGDLLISKVNPGGVAYQQYKTGDIAKEGSCAGERTIKLQGRGGYDYIKLSGVLLLREEFDRVARELSDSIVDYRAEVSQGSGSTSGQLVLKLQVVLSQKFGSDPHKLNELSEAFSKQLFVTPGSTLALAIEKKVFASLIIEPVKSITHPTAKPQRLIQV